MFQSASFSALAVKSRQVAPTRQRALPGAGARLAVARHPHGGLIIERSESEKFHPSAAARARCWRWACPVKPMHARMDEAHPWPLWPGLPQVVGVGKAALLPGLGGDVEGWSAGIHAARQAKQMKGQWPDAIRDFSF